MMASDGQAVAGDDAVCRRTQTLDVTKTEPIQHRDVGEPGANGHRSAGQDFDSNGAIRYRTDAFATVPLFYTVDAANRPIVSPRIADLLARIENAELDPVGFATSAALGLSRTDRTPFRSIRRVPPGHSFVVETDGAWRLDKDWSLLDVPAGTFSGTPDEAAEEMRHLVVDAVRRSPGDARSAALHVSGGLDSSSVAAVSCHLDNGPWRGYAVAPVAGVTAEADSEIAVVEPLAAHLGNLKVTSVSMAGLGSEFLDEADNWHGIRSTDPHAAMCADGAAHGVGFMRTGLGGDELASFANNYRSSMPSVNTDRQARVFLAVMAARKGVAGVRARWRGQRPDRAADHMHEHARMLLDPRSIFTADLLGLIRDVQRGRRIWAGGVPATADYRRRLLHRTDFTRRSDVWNMIGRRHGIVHVHPLLDRRVVEFAISLPRHIFGDRARGRRWLFRQAMREFLPPQIGDLGARRTDAAGLLAPIDIAKEVRRLLDHVAELRKGIAGDVFDFDKVVGAINAACRIATDTVEPSKKAMTMSRFTLVQAHRIVMQSKYLGTYF